MDGPQQWALHSTPEMEEDEKEGGRRVDPQTIARRMSRAIAIANGMLTERKITIAPNPTRLCTDFPSVY